MKKAIATAAITLALAGCGAPAAHHATRSAQPTYVPPSHLTAAQQGYICADLNALHIPGQPDVVYLDKADPGYAPYYQFAPAQNDAGLAGIYAPLPVLKRMIRSAVASRCPRFGRDLQVSWP